MSRSRSHSEAGAGHNDTARNRLRTIAVSPESVLLALTFASLVLGGICTALGSVEAAHVCWVFGTVSALLPALWWVLRGIVRGKFGVDVIAVLALTGSLVVHEYLAGALIGLMLATGRVIEATARRRATRDLRSLLDRVPRTVRVRRGSRYDTVPVGDVEPDDVLSIPPGEMVAVDGRVESMKAVVDESSLTGEPLAVTRSRGDSLRSGVVNAGSAFTMRARRSAVDSGYAAIVRLAREASAEQAPVVRLADRLAGWFVPAVLMVCGIAWLIGGADRAVAVLVVATPCPLLLAAPIAIVSGLSRASKYGVVIKDGAALENLARARTLILDKTGTLTTGRPERIEVTAGPEVDPSEIVYLAASADQFSSHVFAAAIEQEAARRERVPTIPLEVIEQPGVGVAATVDGRRVEVGSTEVTDTAPLWARAVLDRAELDGAALVWVRVDGQIVGALSLMDRPRRGAFRTLRRLRQAGFSRIVMVTGDRRQTALQVGGLLALDSVLYEQSPNDKYESVRTETSNAPTVMVGDGLNDSVALAEATVGVAMGAHGSAAASEIADVVLTADRIDPLADAMETARRSRRIALESAAVGTSLSLVAMGFATMGLIAAAPGALLQEVIDVAVIANALRALTEGMRLRRRRLSPGMHAMLRQFSAEHDRLRGDLALLSRTARLLTSRDDGALDSLHEVDRFLFERILPHEHSEESQLYPAVGEVLEDTEATATMSRMHAEIDRLVHRVRTHLERATDSDGVSNYQRDDLIATLYGLSELLDLHFAQEEENYFSMDDDHARPLRDRAEPSSRSLHAPSGSPSVGAVSNPPMLRVRR